METQKAEKQIKGEILEEFDLDGLPAKVIRAQPGDIDEEDLTALAENLANTNFSLLKIPSAEERMRIKDEILYVREQIENKFAGEEDKIKLTKLGEKIISGNFSDLDKNLLMDLRKILFKVRDKIEEKVDPSLSEELNSVAQAIYPDHTREEHINKYLNKDYLELMAKGQLLAVQIGDKTVAVQSYKQLENTPEGRPVYFFGRASTLDNPQYRKKGFNTRLKKIIFDQIIQKNSDALFVVVSRNKDHLDRFNRRGWHVVDADSPNLKGVFEIDQEEAKQLKSQEVKVVYFDPKVDNISWN